MRNSGFIDDKPTLAKITRSNDEVEKFMAWTFLRVRWSQEPRGQDRKALRQRLQDARAQTEGPDIQLAGADTERLCQGKLLMRRSKLLLFEHVRYI